MAREIGELRRKVAEQGRSPDSVIVTAIFALHADEASPDRLQALSDAGVSRIVLHVRQDAIDVAAGGRTHEIVKRLSAVVETAAQVS
jgi:hypothetical protein